MKRTKKWWSKLSKKERIELVNLERFQNHSYYSSYIPDDCSECGYCGTPHLGNGLCQLCLKRLIQIIDKANFAMKRPDNKRMEPTTKDVAAHP